MRFWTTRLFFSEVIGVDALHFVAGGEGHAEAVVDHEGGEFFAVDQDDAGVVFRGGGEGFPIRSLWFQDEAHLVKMMVGGKGFLQA